MTTAVQSLFHQLEDRREAMLNAFRAQPTEQFSKRPAPHQWSAAEVLSHLVAAERLSVAYIQKKSLSLSSLPKTGLWDDLKMGLLIISQRMPGLKFKAPQRVVENTTTLGSLAEIEAAWKSVRDDLRLLLEKLPDGMGDRKVYRHPAVGYLNIKHALIFFREHLIHHGPQLRRLLK